MTTTTMTEIQRQALRLMAEQNIGAMPVKGFGWVFPTHIRNDFGRFGEGRAIEAAAGVVRQLVGSQTALVRYDPRFHKFDWTTVADAAQQALMNRCASLGRQTDATLASVREATRVVRDLTATLQG